MRSFDVKRGQEDWQTGRVAMSFHNQKGERVGPWPHVFAMLGTQDWTACERLYAIPLGATTLSLYPCNLGASGSVEFRKLSLTVARLRVTEPADAPLPPNFVGDPWSLDDAWRQTTPTRERISLNGLWGFRPLLTNELATTVSPPTACWGWFKVPGVWPQERWELGTSAQQVWLAPWLEEHHSFVNIERAWYKRVFCVPPTWESRRIVLNFTMLQTHAQVFVDGKAHGTLWYPGGELDLTAALTPGSTHELALLVTALPLTAEHNAFVAPDRIITNKATVKHRGITGDLYLCATPNGPRLKDAHISTTVTDMRISFAAECEALPSGTWQLQVAVTSLDGSHTQNFTPGNLTPTTDQLLRFSAPWPQAKLWDTHTTQNRYQATIDLINAHGERVDTLTPITFGFREIKIVDRDFILNGSPIHLRTLHNASANTTADRSNYHAAVEMCRRAQEYGFNLLIMGNYDFSPGSVSYLDGLLQACDDTGTLLSFSLPHIKDFNYRLEDPAIAALYRQQTAWLIRRARNHPSVIFYAMNHNCTGYSGDQNPLKIDGIYAIDEDQSIKGDWGARRNRPRARLAQEIAHSLDPTRPIYHHQSGNLGTMHTVNCYLNWAPIQERSDWLEHWSIHGIKPLFFVEWGLPHISSWSSYRGPQFIWSCKAFQSLWAAEYAAQFWGDNAYLDTPEALEALAREEHLWATGAPFDWHNLIHPLRNITQNYQCVLAHYANDNWRMHRAHGASAMLPWDQGEFWQRVTATATTTLSNALTNLKEPGIVHDRLYPHHQYIYDPGAPENFIPTPIGHSWLRWNQPDCAFIAGPTNDISLKDHLFSPGTKVRKSLVIINDHRQAQRVDYTWRLLRKSTKLNEKSGSLTLATGSQIRLPLEFIFPRRAMDGELIRLTAVCNFESGATQVDDLRLHAVAPPKARRLAAPLQLYDPTGATAPLLTQLKLPFRVLSAEATPTLDEVLIIGRAGLDHHSAAWLKLANQSLNTLVCEQSGRALEELVGLRTTERGSRQLFPRYPHPVTADLTDTHFRDWSGAATLVPPYLPDLPLQETHSPRWRWLGFENTRVWRCGNRGCVASVLIEKPARGDWRALLDGEFDLQYTPLLECVTGAGRTIFSQLDITARTAREPIAEHLLYHLLNYLSIPQWHSTRETILLGEQAQNLALEVGLAQTSHSFNPLLVAPPHTLLIAASGTPPPTGVLDAVAQGMHLLCLAMNERELAAWCPDAPRTVTTNGYFGRIETLPPELNGLSNADWAWHGAIDHEALQLTAAQRKTANSALQVIEHGHGRIVLWQVPPSLIDASAKPWLRTTKRHAHLMAARLLSNLGGAFQEPLVTLPAKLYCDTPIATDDPYRYYRW